MENLTKNLIEKKMKTICTTYYSISAQAAPVCINIFDSNLGKMYNSEGY